MNEKVQRFIEQNVQLVDTDLKEFVRRAFDRLSSVHAADVLEVLQESDIETKDAQEACFHEEFINTLDDARRYPGGDDRSHSWSRFQYIMCGCRYFGLSYNDCKEYCLKHQNEMGIQMVPLEPEYGYMGEGDYDLGDFDKYEFRNEYPEDFED